MKSVLSKKVFTSVNLKLIFARCVIMGMFAMIVEGMIHNITRTCPNWYIIASDLLDITAFCLVNHLYLDRFIARGQIVVAEVCMLVIAVLLFISK